MSIRQGNNILAGLGGTYVLHPASATTLGGVKVDGTTVMASSDGTISASGGIVRFCANSGNATGKKEDLLSYSGGVITTKTGGSYPNLVVTNASGTTTTVSTAQSLDMSSYPNGLYNIFVKTDGTLEAFYNNIFIQPGQPYTSITDNLVPTGLGYPTDIHGYTWANDAYGGEFSLALRRLDCPAARWNEVILTASSLPVYGGIIFPANERKDLYSYSITTAYYLSILARYATGWQIYGTTDYGNTWTLLDTRTGQSFSANQGVTYTYTLSTPALGLTGIRMTLTAGGQNEGTNNYNIGTGTLRFFGTNRKINDLWVNPAQPSTVYKYDGTNFVSGYTGTPIARAQVTGGAITAVYSNRFNVNPILTAHNKIAFSAMCSWTTIPASTWTTVSFQDELEDTDDAWNGTTFTAPVSGTYVFEGVFTNSRAGVASGTVSYCALIHNGVALAFTMLGATISGGLGTGGLGGSAVTYLNAGDTISMAYYSSAATTGWGADTSEFCHFSGHLLS